VALIIGSDLKKHVASDYTIPAFDLSALTADHLIQPRLPLAQLAAGREDEIPLVFPNATGSAISQVDEAGIRSRRHTKIELQLILIRVINQTDSRVHSVLSNLCKVRNAGNPARSQKIIAVTAKELIATGGAGA